MTYLARTTCSALAAGCTLAAAALLMPSNAHADSTIKHPGDHPEYHVEIEPHLAIGLERRFHATGIGPGVRFSIPLVHNGFVSSINNSVAIGFGLDWFHYGGCYYRNRDRNLDLCDANYLVFPVVLQWNFFVAQRWSVFGEPGLAIYHGFYDDCPPGAVCDNYPSHTGINPFVFYAGGRYHFNDSMSLTMRIGWPSVSIGVSFFP